MRPSFAIAKNSRDDRSRIDPLVRSVAMEKSSSEPCDVDPITEELASVLLSESRLDFDALFSMVLANLHARKLATADEALLRPRIYQKLQRLVETGCVEKRGERYRGVALLLSEPASRRAAEHCRELLAAVRKTPFERAR